jgi:hypothetical protein
LTVDIGNSSIAVRQGDIKHGKPASLYRQGISRTTRGACGSTASKSTNISEHPAFHNTARMIARLYDALHRDPAEKKNV